MPLKEPDKPKVIRTRVFVLCKCVMITSSLLTERDVLRHVFSEEPACMSKGHAELGVAAVICAIPVCGGNVTLGVYWGCFTQSTYRFGQVSNGFNI